MLGATERDRRLPRCNHNMATKRKRGDDIKPLQTTDALKKQLSLAITTHASAEITLLHIMEEYDFNLSQLQQILSGMPFSFRS
jgi:hypothetical protein